jgi:hypothetical protein
MGPQNHRSNSPVTTYGATPEQHRTVPLLRIDHPVPAAAAHSRKKPFNVNAFGHWQISVATWQILVVLARL